MLEITMEPALGPKEVIRGRWLEISPIGVQINGSYIDPKKYVRITAMSTTPTEEEAAKEKSLQEALERCKEWQLTDEEVEELLR